jgi:dienelactone hydrolase
MSLSKSILLVLSIGGFARLQGAVTAKPVEYKADTVTLAGILVSDPAAKEKRPGIVLFSDWMGVGENAKAKAEKIAALGYTVLVADVYGKGNNPADAKAAAAASGKYKSDRPLMRKRAAAGLARLKQVPGVDTSRLAAMGYCFGGTVALELARTGAGLRGAVSVHGNLDTPDPAMAKAIKGTVLALHGANDPYVPPEQVRNFQDEMRKAEVDWYMMSFGNAVHSFTKPEAGDDPSDGQAYDAKADARSFEAMKDFYAEVFKAAPTRK